MRCAHRREGILTHYLPLYFPEAERFHRSSRTDWFLAFLVDFPSTHMITAMAKESFVEAAWPILGGRVGKSELLSDIYETSKASVALPVLPDSEAIRMFRLVLAEWRSLTRQRNEIEDRAVSKIDVEIANGIAVPSRMIRYPSCLTAVS